MAETAIGADIHQALDVHRDLAATRSLHLELRLDDLTEPPRLLLGETLHTRVRADARHGEDLRRGRATDPKDVGQRDLDALLVR